MESEKVKDLKKGLEFNAGIEHHDKLSYIEGYTPKQIAYKEIFNYINELESENERLKHLREVDYKTATTLRQANTELNECMDEMQDRIAELEKRCHFIWALGYDYDGCEKAESLKSLIDELVAISQGNWGNICSKCENKLDNLINDKLKQFAEKIKMEFYYEFDELIPSIMANKIDETLKESIKE